MRTALSILLLLLGAHTVTRAQLVDDPRYLFETISWDDKPEDLTWKAGILWDSVRDSISVSQFKTGLTDIFEVRGRMLFSDKDLGVLCEFFRADSVLGALMVTMARFSLPFGPDIDSLMFDEDIMDLMWDENADRFGEPEKSRWIPFVARSREWVLDSVTVRMARLYTPYEVFYMSYFRNERAMDGDLRRPASRSRMRGAPIR